MWDSKANLIPICVCQENNVAIELPYVATENCQTKCPGDEDQFCGDRVDPSTFSFYCVHSMEEDVNCTQIIHEPPDLDDPVDDGCEDYGDNHGNCTTTTTTAVITTTTTTDGSTSTADVFTTTTTSQTITGVTATTETSTATAESTNTDDPTSNDTPPTAYTTTGSPIMPITTTPKPQFCQVKCDDVDHYEKPWTACAGLFAVKPCPNGATGRARWYCSNNGTFAGDIPDYSNCTSPWFDELMENLNDTFFEVRFHKI